MEQTYKSLYSLEQVSKDPLPAAKSENSIKIKTPLP